MIQSTDLQFLGRAGVNYLLSPGAETGRQGWSLFTTTFTSNVPTTISAGAANCTLTSSTTTPLRGTRSLSFAVTTAAGSAGQGFISDVFTIDNADLAKVLTAAFDYNFSAGGTSVDVSGATTQTLEIWVYNVGLAAWTQPAGFRGINQNSLPGYVAATFQTDSSNASNKNQYRVAVIIKNAPTGTFTMQVDQAVVGPQTVQYGAPVTDWDKYYTPVITGSISNPALGTNTNIAKYRRVGDSLEIEWFFNQSTAGTTGSGTYYVSLPPGLSIDPSKLSSTAGGAAPMLGSATLFNNTNRGSMFVLYQDSTHFFLSGLYQAGEGEWGSGFYSLNNTTLYVRARVVVPILGWSSTVQMSNDTDTRVVAARISVPSGAQTLTNNVSTKIIGLSAEFDTHGAFNSSLQRYEIKVPGVYKVTWQVGILSAATDRLSAQIYKTGSLFTTTYIAGSSQGAAAPVSSTLINCTTSDYLEFYGAMEGTATRNTNPGSNSIFASIERLSGPSAIAATESVTGKYENTAGTALTGNVEATLPYATKKYDSHGAFSGTVFTAPISGVYQFSSTVSLQAVANTTNQVLAAGFRVTSTPESISAQTQYVMVEWGNGVSHGQVVTFTKSYKLNAGDTVEVRALNTNSVSLATDAGVNFFCWNRVGN